MILKEKREQLSLTLDEMADRLHISQGALSYYENYKRFPKIYDLRKIMYAYKMSPVDLLTYIYEAETNFYGGDEFE